MDNEFSEPTDNVKKKAVKDFRKDMDLTEQLMESINPKLAKHLKGNNVPKDEVRDNSRHTYRRK